MNDESQSVIAEINSSLSLAAKRQHGLFKMISYLENCSNYYECTLLEQNCAFWLRTIFQIFENHPVSLHAKLAQYAFYLIIQNSKSLSPDLQRHISTSLVEKAVHLLLSSNDLLSKNSLLCLNELMSCYKAPCSQFRGKIENYVYARLESDSDEILKWASVCYAKLPYSSKNTNNTDLWYTYFKNMLQNANLLLNDLFEDYQQITQIETTQEQETTQQKQTDTRTFTKLVKDSENLEFYFKKSLKRFKACCFCLSSLFEPLNEKVVIKIRYTEIINFLKRILLFDFKKLANNSRMNMESKYLSDIMSEMLTAVFSFSEKFFNILNTNLVPQSPVLNNMLINIGHCIIENNMDSVFSSYYSCLNTWMTSVGYNSGFYKNSFSIIENLLNKIKPVEKNALSIEKNEHGKSKHSKQSTSFGVDKSCLNTHQVILKNKLVTSALQCLKTFIKNFSFNLSYNQFEKIHSTVIDIILCVQYNSNIRKPYDQVETRLCLYETLFDLCLSKNLKISPPVSISIGLFKNASNETSKEIQSFSKHCLTFLRSLTYPLQPTYLKEFTIEASTQPIENFENLVLPTNSNQVKSEKSQDEKTEISEFLSNQENHMNGYRDNQDTALELNLSVKNTVSLTTQNNKRKMEYEDDDEEDEEMDEEDEIEYQPKSLAKKFQPNGHFQSRGVKPLNGRDVENSNGDDDEEEEEVISLDEEEEEDENLEEDEDEEDEVEDEVEDVEEEDEENEEDEVSQEKPSEEMVEQVVEQQVVQHVEIETHEPQETPEMQESQGEEKINSESNPEIAEEVKNLIEQTGDYDDESKDTETKSSTKETIESENGQQEISMATLETVPLETLENGTDKDTIEYTESEPIQEDDTENDKSTQEEEAQKEEIATEPVDSEEFDEAKLNQMCSSFNVNALAENN